MTGSLRTAPASISWDFMIVSRVVGAARNVVAVVGGRWFFRSAKAHGRRVRVWGRATMLIDGDFRTGDRIRLVGRPVPIEIAVGPNGTLTLGDNVYINYGCSIAAMQSVHIGSGVHIGPYVFIMDNDFHRLEPERRNEMPPSAPIHIGDNVWLGARAINLRHSTRAVVWLPSPHHSRLRTVASNHGALAEGLAAHAFRVSEDTVATGLHARCR